MTIIERIQEGIKECTKNREMLRLDTLRMAKGALLLKEKESPHEHGVSDEEAVAALRAEVKKRQQSMETYEQVGRMDTVETLKQEIAVIEEYLPKQLDEAALGAKVREYLAEHPEINHAGKLTGALKKELGDLADGRMLSELCKKALE